MVLESFGGIDELWQEMHYALAGVASRAYDEDGGSHV